MIHLSAHVSQKVTKNMEKGGIPFTFPTDFQSLGQQQIPAANKIPQQPQMAPTTPLQTSPTTPLNPMTAPAATTTKRSRQKKGEYYRKLEEENIALKNAIREFEQKINTLDVQNETLMHQLKFFQSCLPLEGAGIAPPIPQDNAQTQQNPPPPPPQ